MSAIARTRALRWSGAALALAGGVTAAGALAQPLQAQLGTFLLERAWAQTVETAAAQGEAAPVRPWPWADIAPVARVAFPTLGETRVVLDQASGEAMAWGAGHVRGTAGLGAPGLTAIAAHRDTHFALLGDLGPGDRVEVETADGRRLAYEVEGARVIDATTWRFPALFEGPDILALSTCWPLGSITPGPERLVLFARRVETTA